ncbi:MAG: hypothetical protein RDV48_28290 [Candidatus Eremiobacteraeota bacterium]|nr:hypothetical protein [Candidatus Eremiobacteraeota bacterium]
MDIQPLISSASNASSATAGQASQKPSSESVQEAHGSFYNDKIDTLGKEYENVGENIKSLQDMKVKTEHKARSNNTLGLTLGFAGAIGCFALAATAGGAVSGVLPLVVMFGAPIALLLLTARSSAQKSEAMKQQAQIVEAEQAQKHIMDKKEKIEEWKAVTDKVTETAVAFGADGEGGGIVNDDDSTLIIGGIKLKKSARHEGE